MSTTTTTTTTTRSTGGSTTTTTVTTVTQSARDGLSRDGASDESDDEQAASGAAAADVEPAAADSFAALSSSDKAVVREVMQCMQAVPGSTNLSDELKAQFRCFVGAGTEDLQVKKNSGFGGSSTFKVALGDAAVCVHVYGPAFAGTPVDDLFKSRVRKAQAAYSAAGIASPRIGEWSGGFVEPWISGGAIGVPTGTDWAQVLSEEKCEALGALLASVHKVPQEWFEEWRQATRQQFPQLDDAGVGTASYLWKDAGLVGPPLASWLDKATLEVFENTGPWAASEAGKAIVSVHGDFHLANMLIGSDSYLVCDFENSGVGPAVGDLCCELPLHLSLPSPCVDMPQCTGTARSIASNPFITILKLK